MLVPYHGVWSNAAQDEGRTRDVVGQPTMHSPPRASDRYAHLLGLCIAVSLLSTGTLWLLAPPMWKLATAEFWLDDLPPMHGMLRILAYGGLLLLMFPWQRLGGSPLQAPETWRWTAR